jgi:hypothetical protein
MRAMMVILSNTPRIFDRMDVLGRRAEESHLLRLPGPKPHPEGQEVGTALLFGGTSLPVRLIADPTFRAFMRGTAPGYRTPSVRELRRAILGIAEQFRLEFSPIIEEGSFCNLITDTATSGGRTWLGVCVSTARGFSFWRCASITDQTADTLPLTLDSVCVNLREKRVIVCAIRTDNANNEIAAVRTLSNDRRRPLFRVPYLSHTATLAVTDFLEEVFPAVAGRNFFDRMTELLNLLPHRYQRDAFHGDPPSMSLPTGVAG